MVLLAGKAGTENEIPPLVDDNDNVQLSVGSYQGEDKDTDTDDYSEVCRVCHCVEPDKKGEAALEFLGISPPLGDKLQRFKEKPSADKTASKYENGLCSTEKRREQTTDYVKYVSPNGDVIFCGKDLEAGPGISHNDGLIQLGCQCKNELALGHYACALRWFSSHESIVCEICGGEAQNVRLADLNKAVAAVKECENLRARTVAGEVTPAQCQLYSGVDPDALAAVRRQRLTEIASWFNPRFHTATVSQITADEVSNVPSIDVQPNTHPTTKWVFEGTGILIATGLLTVTLTWLLAPRVGKKTAKSGLHILLGGLCALTVVVFLRFISREFSREDVNTCYAILPKMKYGRARYWAIVFVFMFLVFGIWASRTRATRSS